MAHIVAMQMPNCAEKLRNITSNLLGGQHVTIGNEFKQLASIAIICDNISASWILENADQLQEENTLLRGSL
jgi:hypothetical protein